MWSKKMIFCAFAMALLFPLSAVAGEPGLDIPEQVPEQPAKSVACDSALEDETNMAEVALGEPFNVEQLIARRGGEGGSWSSCQYETCDMSVDCWEACEAQWCAPSQAPCADEDGQQGFCWCVRACSDICV